MPYQSNEGCCHAQACAGFAEAHVAWQRSTLALTIAAHQHCSRSCGQPLWLTASEGRRMLS